MEDKNGATQFIDQIPALADSAPGTTRPMYLIVLSGGIPGSMLRLDPGGTRLGRSPDNGLQLPETSVSRHHAFLKIDPDGMARLTDLGSTNGTFLNGQKLADHLPALLRDGDRLRFGSTMVVKFVRPDSCEERFQLQMYERTVRDPLTGLYNRAYFLEQVGPLAERGIEKGLGLALLMLDIDHFKRINDTYGHHVGDSVLREVATVLRQSTRTEDLVARYGGEEFIVALPIAAADQAADRADRMRRALSGRRLVIDDNPLRVTASIGMAFSSANRPKPVNALILAADQCLYQAKNSGRDRVIRAKDSTPTLDPESQQTAEQELRKEARRNVRPAGL